MKDFDKIDVALVPNGGIFTMDIEEAFKAVSAIKTEFVIPMHIRDVDPMEFKIKVEKNSDIKVIPLQIGENFNLK